MKTLTLSLAAALLATTAGSVNAASIGLSTNYSVDFIASFGDVREAGGVTYDWDTNTLMVIGDETEWSALSPTDGSVIRGGPAYLGGLKYKDTEGLAYLGNNVWVLAQERVVELNKLAADGYAWPFEKDAPTFQIMGPTNIGNEGLEGVSWDRHTGDFYAIKETNDQKIWHLTGVDFAGNGTVEELFDPALLGLRSLSDISVLSNSDAFFGTAFGDNLLILSATSEMLLEVTKAGEILSRFDLSDIPVETIEGVTVDNLGNIYLAGENSLVGLGSGLIKLKRNEVAAAVPEPATWAMMLGGLGLVGGAMRRRKVSVAFA